MTSRMSSLSTTSCTAHGPRPGRCPSSRMVSASRPDRPRGRVRVVRPLPLSGRESAVAFGVCSSTPPFCRPRWLRAAMGYDETYTVITILRSNFSLAVLRRAAVRAPRPDRERIGEAIGRSSTTQRLAGGLRHSAWRSPSCWRARLPATGRRPERRWTPVAKVASLVTNHGARAHGSSSATLVFGIALPALRRPCTSA